MAALGGAENAAGPANLEIPHGNAKTGAKRAVLLDRVNPFARGADRPNFAGCLRDKIDNFFPDSVDCLNPVVQKINLALPFELSIVRVANDPLVVTADNRFHRQTV